MSNKIEICPEIEFAQLLASNQPKVCNRALKKVEKWLESKSYSDDGLNEDGMLKLWKGLYYYFWNLDKPLVQEDIAEKISKFVHVFKKQKLCFLFIDTFFQTMSREWFAIDRYRLEKFMMFFRKFLRENFVMLKNLEWEISAIKEFRNIIKSTLCKTSGPCSMGFKLHITDIFMEELARVGSDTISSDQLKSLLVTFCTILRNSVDVVLLKGIEKDIFVYLINQNADEEMFEAFPMLKYDPKSIVEMLQKHKDKGCLKKINKKIMDRIIAQYEAHISNEHDLPEENVKSSNTRAAIKKRTYERAAQSLVLEQENFVAEKRAWKKTKRNARKEELVEDLDY